MRAFTREFCRQFHGHIAGPFVIEYAADVTGGAPTRIRLARPRTEDRAEAAGRYATEKFLAEFEDDEAAMQPGSRSELFARRYTRQP